MLKVALSLAYTMSNRGRSMTPSPEASPLTAATRSLGNVERLMTRRSTAAAICAAWAFLRSWWSEQRKWRSTP